MAVGILDGAILAVWNQFRTLIDAHSPPGIHGLFLGVVMTAAAFSVFALYIPTSVWVGNYMMFFSCHCFLSLDFVKHLR